MIKLTLPTNRTTRINKITSRNEVFIERTYILSFISKFFVVVIFVTEDNSNGKCLQNIIKELKSNHIGYYYDKICDAVGRKYGFENSTADNYLYFCISSGFITPANSRGKLSYRLVAVPDINIDGEDSLTSTIAENPQSVIPRSATSSSTLNEGGRRQAGNFSDRASLINCDNGGKILMNYYLI